MSPRQESLRKAVGRLREALAEPESAIVRDAAIQRFEFCFELAWKAIQEAARVEGRDCRSPKGCLQIAFQMMWIESEAEWLKVLADRNATSHTYDETLAKEIYGRLGDYLPLFDDLVTNLDRLQS